MKFNTLFFCLLTTFLGLMTSTAQVGILGHDRAVCAGSGAAYQVVLDATTPGATAYTWSNNLTTPSITVQSTTAQTVTYSVDVYTGTSFTTDNIKVQYMLPASVPVPVTPVNTCKGTVNLSTSAPGGGVAYWYTSQTAGTPIGVGTVFPYYVANSQTLYVENIIPSTIVSTIGHPGIGDTWNTVAANNPLGVRFTVSKPCRLQSAMLYAEVSGSVTVELRNEQDITIDSRNVSVLGSQLFEVDLDFDLIPNSATNNYYRLVVTSSTAGRLRMQTSGMGSGTYNPSGFPNGSQYEVKNVFRITSNQAGQYTNYPYFFNMKIRQFGCPSARVPLTINMYPSPTIALTDTLICGTTATLSMGNQPTGTTYTWYKGSSVTTNPIGTAQTQSISSPTSAYTAQATTVTGGNSCTETKTFYAIFSSNVTNPTVTGSTNVCKGQTNLTATSTAGSVILWWDYAAPALKYLGSTNSGSPFSYNAQASDTVYAQAFNKANINLRVGVPARVSNMSHFSTANSGLRFDAHKSFILDSVTVYPLQSGTMVIMLQNSSGQIVDTVIRSATVAQAYQKVDLKLNMVIPKGTGWRLLLGLNTVQRLSGQRQTAFPIALPGFVSILGNVNTSPFNYYACFYNWKVKPLACSATKATYINVNNTPTVVQTDDIFSCGTAVTVNAGNWGSNVTYAFKNLNNGASLGGGLNVNTSNSITTGTVKVEITGTIGGCSVKDTVNVQIFPASITAPTAAPQTSCGGTISLTASAGSNQIIWWDSPTGGSVVGWGSPLAYQKDGNACTVTYDTLYAQSMATATFTQTIGAKTPTTASTTANLGLAFNVSAGKAIIIDTVSVYYTGATATTVKIELTNAAGTVLASRNFTLAAGSINPQRLAIKTSTLPGWFAYEGNGYRLVSRTSGVSLGRNTGISYPFGTNLTGVVQIVGGVNASTGTTSTTEYNYFYDWKIRVVPCASATRTPKYITILKTPVLDLGVDKVSCAAQECFNAQNTCSNFQWYKNGQAISAANGGTASVFCASQTGGYTGANQLTVIASVANTGAATCRDTAKVMVNLMPSAANPTAPNVSGCAGTIQLTATNTNGDAIIWWTTANPNTYAGIGSPFTPPIPPATTYNAQAYQVSDMRLGVGIPKPSSGQYAATTATNQGVRFIVGQSNPSTQLVPGLYLDSVSIYTELSGLASVGVYEFATGNLVGLLSNYPTVAAGSALATPTQLPLNMWIPRGDYILRMISCSNCGQVMTESTPSTGFYATSNPLVVLKENGTSLLHLYMSSGMSGSTATSTLYQFYDWRVRILPTSSGCPSSKTLVTVSVLPTPNLTNLQDTTRCGTGCVTLSMPAGNTSQSWTYDPLPIGGATTTSTALTSNQVCTPTLLNAWAKIGNCVSTKDIKVDIVANPSSPIVSDQTVCPGYVQVVASSPNADYLAWYNGSNAATSSQIGGGDTLNYYVEGVNQSVYAQAYNIGNFTEQAGMTIHNSTPPAPLYAANSGLYGLVFDVYKPMIIDSVSLYVKNTFNSSITGFVVIQVVKREFDAALGAAVNTVIYTKKWGDWSVIRTAPNGRKYVRVPLGFFMTPNNPGVSYALVLSGNSVTAGPNADNQFGYNSGTGLLPLGIPGVLNISGSNAAVSAFNPSLNHYYYFFDWGIRTAKCSSPRVKVNLTLYPAPTHTVNLGKDTTRCGNYTLALGSFPNNYSYGWFEQFNNNPLAATNSYTINNSGTYVGVVYNENGCGVYDTVNVTINPNPVANISYSPTFGPPCVVDFGSAGSSAGTYSWNFGHPSSGANNTSTLPNPQHTYTVKGSYNVSLTVTNACGTQTANVSVDCYGVDIEDPVFGNLKVFPNPTADLLNIDLVGADIRTLNIRLVNALGQSLMSRQSDVFAGNASESLNVSSLTNGLYYLILESEGKTLTQKVIVER